MLYFLWDILFKSQWDKVREVFMVSSLSQGYKQARDSSVFYRTLGKTEVISLTLVCQKHYGSIIIQVLTWFNIVSWNIGCLFPIPTVSEW